jgi:hypothetical protein
MKKKKNVDKGLKGVKIWWVLIIPMLVLILTNLGGTAPLAVGVLVLLPVLFWSSGIPLKALFTN